MERAKELQKLHGLKLGAGLFRTSFKKFDDDSLVALLTGKWSGWVRQDLGLKVVPDMHPGRLTKWIGYIFGITKKQERRTRGAMEALADGIDESKAKHARHAAVLVAAVRGQACWRGIRTRRWTLPMLVEAREAAARAEALALRVRKLWRLAICAGRLSTWIVPARIRIAQREAAAVVLQAAARPAPLVPAFLAKRDAHRAELERKRRRAATIRIQRQWRGGVARVYVAGLQCSAAQIQACWRGWSFRELDGGQRKAVLMRSALGIARKCETVLASKPYSWPWRGYQHDDWEGWWAVEQMRAFTWRVFLQTATPRVIVIQAACRGRVGRQAAWQRREDLAARLLQRLARTGPGSIARAELLAARRLWASKVIQTNWRTYQAWKAWRETDPLTYLLRWKACIEISRRWRGHVARWRCRYLRAKRLWEPWLRRGGLLPPRGSIEKAKLKVRKQIRLIEEEEAGGGSSLNLLNGWFGTWGLPQRPERIALLEEIAASQRRWEASLEAHEGHLVRSEVVDLEFSISQVVASTTRSGHRSWALKLSRAAQVGDTAVVVNALAWLISHGASKGIVDDTSLDPNGQSAFGYACEGGHYKMAQLLLDVGANPEHRRKSGHSPFVAACYRGDLQTVQWLYQLPTQNPRMAPINVWSKPYDDSDGFVGAAERGHLDVVQFFVETLEASTEHWCGTSSGGRAALTPFVAAMAGGRLQIARYLFLWGFNTHQAAKRTADHPDGPGPLSPMDAAEGGRHQACIDYLLWIYGPKCPELAAAQREAILKPLPQRDALASTLDFGTTMAPPKLPLLNIKGPAPARKRRRKRGGKKKSKKERSRRMLLADEVKVPPREELEQYMTAIELARPRFFRDATKHLRTSAEQDIPSLMPGVVE